MNRSKKRILAAVVTGALVALVWVAPASATLLLDITIDTWNKDVYQVGEDVGVVFYVYNAGNEVFQDGVGSDHLEGTSLWVFENAAGLSRDGLLGEEEPIWTEPMHVYYFHRFDPGDTFMNIWWGSLYDALNGPIGPGQYTLLAVDGPYPGVWRGATVDYSNAIANITIVPEPGTACLLAGLAVAGILRKGRRPGR